MTYAEKSPAKISNQNFSEITDSQVPDTSREHHTPGCGPSMTSATCSDNSVTSKDCKIPQALKLATEENVDVLSEKRLSENDALIHTFPGNPDKSHEEFVSPLHNKPEFSDRSGLNADPGSPSRSVASISSSESTTKLIQNLSIDEGVHGEKKDIEPALSASSFHKSEEKTKPHIVHSIEETEQKKPIKFTVRKVSREQKLTKDHARDNEAPVTRRYGNLAENKLKSTDRKSGDKASQLKNCQTEYDEYVTRIEKIEKEISFLTTLLPPFNVEIDYATRSKITRAIDKLRSKKDEVEKKKYELGMSISRLWRDFDDNNTWVRSVSKH